MDLVTDWPEPVCGPDEVIVRVHGVGLCGTDLAVIDGKAVPPSTPWVVGHEGGGEIVAIGAAVRDRSVGQRVVIEPNLGCGTCQLCQDGRTSRCAQRQSIGHSTTGLLAERVAVRADHTWVVPDDMPVAAIACFEPLVVADTAVRRAGVAAGDEVLILGAGSVGQLLAQVVLAAGAVPFVIDTHPGRLAHAVDLGARNGAERPGHLYPFVFETTGAGPAWQTAFDSVALGGLLTLIGFTRDAVPVIPMELVRRQVTVRGHLIYDHPADFGSTLARVRDAELVPEQGVHAVHPVTDAQAAFDAVRQVPGKTWLDFSPWLD
ncbi:zinc-binding dehydrogenase [Microbacterium sp. NPDC058389]|uniref:zinc-dependent alcohol dehydrogenase n=1 Tax=Microbacterium sp. NPDC058389 TaxID=3346475 RepID=UPI00365EC259